MESLSNLTDAQTLLIADASAVINLNASGCAEKVLEALARRVKVVDFVPGELEEGRQRQRQDVVLLEKLAASGHVEIVSLDETSDRYFEQLVVGPGRMTLDDGEAGTIAYALAGGGIPIIDEAKANRICAELFPDLRLACSVDIFANRAVGDALGNETLADAVFNALYHGRMRVFPQHLAWVVGLIGHERARQCASLPASARALKSAAMKRAGQGG